MSVTKEQLKTWGWTFLHEQPQKGWELWLNPNFLPVYIEFNTDDEVLDMRLSVEFGEPDAK